MNSHKFSCNFSWAGARYSLETSVVSAKDKVLTHLAPFSLWYCFVNVKLWKTVLFFYSNKENKGERGRKKVTYCFLRHVIGLTLLALKLCMMDPSPSTHCWKTQKHQKTKLGKPNREKVGQFVLGEGSSLKPWIMLITCAEEKITHCTAHTMEKSRHFSSILPITISSSPGQRDCAFHSSKCYM